MSGKSSGSRKEPQGAGGLLLNALEERWKNYQTLLKTCQREFSEEGVHDLRVAARRLLAVLNAARALNPGPLLQKTRRFLKDQLDDLDELRDVQVMRREASASIDTLPDLKTFRDFLEGREKRLLRQAGKQIRAVKPSEWRKQIEKIENSLTAELPGASFQAQLMNVVENAYLRTTQAYVQVDAAEPGTIHRLRLAFKKFRYLAELVQPLFPGDPQSRLERMHNYQSAMGDIQDIQTFLNTLADFVESGAASFDPGPILRFYEKRRAEALGAFLEDKGEIVTFWSSRPANPMGEKA